MVRDIKIGKHGATKKAAAKKRTNVAVHTAVTAAGCRTGAGQKVRHKERVEPNKVNDFIDLIDRGSCKAGPDSSALFLY
ncbi:hypothetical protein GWI33_002396 [Rhynchophorus ferrugineus]|uniref:Uncharacterized protein n=1 Tax=Rhynchophorus ferrugineus TaxID=354439 RepID=A0A834IPF2_RHYFE|nr:hypothetical protein GWI33_002396 [Rhynchophorus ferrugineus]